ncbi:GxxExxY protein [Sungkyunkwania multivorans]|uniref:GxxExxY protein n=1 Tax=Sungkyunkwania multivorans TaxID=1173618 RepID=A0ABW3D3D4_9FLAO
MVKEGLLYREESYKVIGTLFEVHNNLGGGFLEVVYKDALEYEFKRQKIPFERERQYTITYKDIILPHVFFADFVVFDKIVLEVKAVFDIHDSHVAQTINYLKVSSNRVGILANFGTDKLDYRRLIF